MAKTEELCKRQDVEIVGRRRIAVLDKAIQQMVSTIFNAEGRRTELWKELSKRWRVATTSKTDGDEISLLHSVGNQFSGV